MSGDTHPRPNMAIFKQSQKSNQSEIRHAVNGIFFLANLYNHTQVVASTGATYTHFFLIGGP